MGRPRLVRSAEEEATFKERQRERARERARARRSIPEFRQAEAEAKRQRRTDQRVRRAEAEAERQRRAQPEVRARRAERERERRANPRVRQADVESKRQRRSDPEVRAAEARAKAAYREANPEVRKRENEARRRRREENPELRINHANRLLGLDTIRVHPCCRNADPVVPRTARCVVPICHSRSAPSSILYPLPAELSQRQAWIDFVRGCPCGGARDWNPPSNEISLVCSLHFSVRCFRFQRPRGYSVGYSKCLRRDAVPTLYPIEEQCSSVPNENFPDDTAERLVSSGVEDAAGRTPNSLASSRSVAVVQRLSHRLASLLPGQDRGHCASDQDTARRLAHLAAFELTFLKNVSTQCSVEMASKAASCAVRTVSKSVQCSG
ncbi:uncharacterized protein LOC119453846 isoform X3 [Dermacentor silvarum]|uniref:uncharacterized protein LOC119453846 isoform X3 n=1 Tax=Dermacentor silvarum TaxID=543639 RepID=UPI0021007618|nr:uncharacterized protein LOC119453846 isoform X3 [Dermacentor silvarum]